MMRDADCHWFPAPAKLNLFLHVTGRRNDGMHELQTLFQFIDLSDRLGFRLRDDAGIHCHYENAEIDPDSDLVRRAAQCLQPADRAVGIDIRIQKQIPVGGGLGGGSSNAATTLSVLNRLWGLEHPADELAAIGLSLGADVPVFVHGITAWAEGVGERLTPVQTDSAWFLVIHPRCSVSTAEVFADPGLTRSTPQIRIGAAVETATVARLGNDCEHVARSLHPPVDQAMAWLSQRAEAHLSGTGSCVFASFETRSEAETVAAAAPPDWTAFVARGLQRSPLQDAIEREL